MEAAEGMTGRVGKRLISLNYAGSGAGEQIDAGTGHHNELGREGGGDCAGSRLTGRMNGWPYPQTDTDSGGCFKSESQLIESM